MGHDGGVKVTEAQLKEAYQAHLARSRRDRAAPVRRPRRSRHWSAAKGMRPPGSRPWIT